MNNETCQWVAGQLYATGDVNGLLAISIYMNEQGHDMTNINYYLKVKLGVKS